MKSTIPASGHISKRLSKIHANKNLVRFVRRPINIDIDNKDSEKKESANK